MHMLSVKSFGLTLFDITVCEERKLHIGVHKWSSTGTLK